MLENTYTGNNAYGKMIVEERACKERNIVMPKFEIFYQKKLKLTNVLSMTMTAEEMQDMTFAEKMENYIKSKGYQPIGPLVQYTSIQQNESGESEIVIKMLRQSNGYITHAEQPYQMTAVLCVPDCLYLRFIGPQEKLGIAYSKLSVTAYEEDIPLVGSSYTVFVNQLDNEDIVADVFMEKVHD